MAPRIERLLNELGIRHGHRQINWAYGEGHGWNEDSSDY
jgi:hypothetical protein